MSPQRFLQLQFFLLISFAVAYLRSLRAAIIFLSFFSVGVRCSLPGLSRSLVLACAMYFFCFYLLFFPSCLLSLKARQMLVSEKEKEAVFCSFQSVGRGRGRIFRNSIP